MPRPSCSAASASTLMAALALIAVVALPSATFAFSDPASFGAEVQLGGGGGRYFTGSPADGYGCNVCHAGGPSVAIAILGLPTAGYQPGASYELRVEWPIELKNLAVALEITDEHGEGAGSVRLPPQDELPEPERCEPVEDGIPAGMLTELDHQRTIVSVPDCGAKRLRVLWTAPQEARTGVRLAGGLVVSDTKADAAGDGTTLFTRVLSPASGSPAVDTDISGEIKPTCAIGATRTTGLRPGAARVSVALALLALAARRVRRAPAPGLKVSR